MGARRISIEECDRAIGHCWETPQQDQLASKKDLQRCRHCYAIIWLVYTEPTLPEGMTPVLAARDESAAP